MTKKMPLSDFRAVRHKLEPDEFAISEGQDIDGWTVEQILSDRVVFGRADSRIEVKAKDATSRAVPARRAAAPVVPVPDPTNFGVQLGSAPGGG